MLLAVKDRERCYFHLGLGTGAGIPQLVAQLEAAFKAIRSATQATYISSILDRCDNSFKQAYPDNLSLGRVEQIAGDVNRSIQQYNQIDDFPKIWEVYLIQVDLLAQELRVDNCRRLENPRFSSNFSGAEYITVVPGPNDTSTGASITEVLRTGGGFGVSAF